MAAGEGLGDSDFLTSLGPGELGALSEFGDSICGLGLAIEVEVDAGEAGVEELFELEENLELILDIHEFRRPSESAGLGFGSLVPLGVACTGVEGASLSVFARVGR